MWRKRGKAAFCAAKLDIMKAYDRVEWPYLQEIMRKHGFAEACISLIMQCFTTVSLEVKVNCKLFASCRTSRGLRQGGSNFTILVLDMWGGSFFSSQEL
jgi:C4-type Zn-finger protein